MPVNKSDAELVPTTVTSNDERALRAYDLRKTGATWQTVVESLNYQNVNTAKTEVNNLVRKATLQMDAVRREELLDMELDRLDSLQEAAWGMAMSGDTNSIGVVLKVMGHRSKLMQLEGEQGTSVNTVVVSSDNYAKTLKELG